MKPHRPHRRTAFTLIELLVVIAVIAILAAILFPVFAQAREKARQSACLTQMKQIGLATRMYADDYEERYPYAPRINFYASMFVPGPQGTWENMPTRCCGNAAGSLASQLLPYVKNSQVFLCPNDPTGDRFANGLWDGQYARNTYIGHIGMVNGVSWLTLPKGKPTESGQPFTLAEVSKPSLLYIVMEPYLLIHTRVDPGLRRINMCYADGHIRFTKVLGGLPMDRSPAYWQEFNPTLPVPLEEPCTPTCAEVAGRGLRVGHFSCLTVYSNLEPRR